MIKPVNGHILIEPTKHESFMSSENQLYDEVGTILAVSEGLQEMLPLGARAYFDSYMAKKYPNVEDKDSFYWLVHKDEVAGIEI